MDSTLENYVEGQDFGTLRISAGKDDDLAMHFQDRSAWVVIPLYAYQAREIIEILAPLANEPDQ